MNARDSFDLDLRAVDLHRRADTWRQWNDDIFCERVTFADEPPDEPLQGYIRGTRLSVGRLYRLQAAMGRLARSLSPNPSHKLYTAVLLLAGQSTVCQDGQQCGLQAGDMTFLHGGSAFEKTISVGSEMLLLHVPQEVVRARQPGALALVNRCFKASDVGTRVMRSAMLSAFEAGPRLDSAQQASLMLSLVDMLGLPRCDDGPLAPDRDALRVRQALAEIDLGLADRDFNANRLADMLHISRRRLDELFVAELGKPVAPCIWERRLSQAASLLRDARHASRTVTDVALSLGFEDVAHFSRVFKKRYGVTARKWREGADAALSEDG